MDTYNGIFSYNGWIHISMNADTDDDKDDRSDLKAFFDYMEPIVLDFNSNHSRFIEHVPLNFANYYYIGGLHNHMLCYFDELLTLYKKIGEIAKGSFGLLYVRLCEDPEDWNQYKVFRMAKGVVTEHEDALLSPCRPTIEP